MKKCKYEFVHYLKNILVEKQDKDFLINYMAEKCEESYRRGVQQALYMKKTNLLLSKFEDEVQLHDWRFSSLENSSGLDGYMISCKDRFLVENPEWENL